MLDNVSYSERDFLDKLFLFTNSLVIKDQKRAEAGENLDSSKSSQAYMLAFSQRDNFLSYVSYSRSELWNAGMRDEDEIREALSDPNLVPDKYREFLLRQRRKEIIDSYEEPNSYYRMLAGKPPLGEEPVRTASGKYVTELSQKELSILLRDEIGELKRLNPTAEYLGHLGTMSVSYYEARSAKPFYILNYEKYIFEEERAKKFIELYYESMVYVLTTVYTDAFKGQDLYDNFITILIVFNTMNKFINAQFDYAIRKDFYDLESIKNTFLSYGLPFFEEIPMKYQTRIVKNINQLLKYKGTNRVLVDIVSLFGFQNVELFKYYLVKDFKRGANNELAINYENPRDSYDLRFAQVPLESKDVSAALMQDYLYKTYEEVVKDDPFWGGGNENEFGVDEEFKNEILDAEFNYVNTKYISMNTMFNMAQLSFEACYFFNLINTLEHGGLMDEMRFTNNQIKHSGDFIKVFDAVTGLYFLIFKRFGYDDNILYTPTAVGSIFGFNFDGQLEVLRERIVEKARVQMDGRTYGYDPTTLSDADLRVFTQETVDVQKDRMIDIFFENRQFDTHIRERIRKSTDYREFKALSEIHKYNMYSDAVRDLYSEGRQDMYSTYSEYLKEKDVELYDYCVLNSQDKEGIIRAIDTLLISLETYFNSEKFEYIFSSLTNISGELIKQYMRQIVNIFKAYSVELHKINIYYVFDDKFVNMIRLFSFVRSETEKLASESVLRDSYDYNVIRSRQTQIEEGLREIVESYRKQKDKALKDENVGIMRDGLTKGQAEFAKTESMLDVIMDMMHRVARLVDTVREEGFEIKEGHNILLNAVHFIRAEVREILGNSLVFSDAEALPFHDDALRTRDMKFGTKEDGISFRESFQIN